MKTSRFMHTIDITMDRIIYSDKQVLSYKDVKVGEIYKMCSKSMPHIDDGEIYEDPCYIVIIEPSGLAKTDFECWVFENIRFDKRGGFWSVNCNLKQRHTGNPGTYAWGNPQYTETGAQANVWLEYI